MRGMKGLAILIGAGALLALAPQAAPGPVGYWKLDEAAAGTAVDSSATVPPNNATHMGTPVPDAVEKPPLPAGFANPYSLRLDQTGGVDDYVEIPDSASLQNVQEGSYTLSTWFRPANAPAAGTDYGVIIKSGPASEGIYYRSGQWFNMTHWLQGTAGLVAVGASSNFAAAGSWYHVVGVVDTTAKQVLIYVNGTLDATGDWSATNPTDLPAEQGTTPWRIGIADPGATTYKWAAQGHFDDVRIYNRALTATEIQNMYVVDTQAPVVTIQLPTTAPAWTTPSTPLAMSGTATDNVAVTVVTWSNSAGGTGLATLTGTAWSASIPLLAGTNVITITASDAAGNLGTDVLTVTSGPVPPQVGNGVRDHSKCGCGWASEAPSRAAAFILAFCLAVILLKR